MVWLLFLAILMTFCYGRVQNCRELLVLINKQLIKSSFLQQFFKSKSKHTRNVSSCVPSGGGMIGQSQSAKYNRYLQKQIRKGEDSERSIFLA